MNALQYAVKFLKMHSLCVVVKKKQKPHSIYMGFTDALILMKKKEAYTKIPSFLVLASSFLM